MTDKEAPVRDVGGGSGTMVHGKSTNVLRTDENKDPLPRIQSRAYRGVDDGIQTVYAWDGAIDWNQLLVSQIEHILQVFDVSFQKGTSQLSCHFTGCPGFSRTWNGPRNRFI